MKHEELEARLRSFDHLRELDGREVGTLADALEIVEAEDGHRFLEQGKRGDGCWLVIEGEVVVERELEGDISELKQLGPGELFGLVSLIDHGACSATCRARGPVTAAWLPEAAFRLLVDGNAQLVLHFQLLVARQLARDARALNDALVRAMLQDRATSHGYSGEFHLTTEH